MRKLQGQATFNPQLHTFVPYIQQFSYSLRQIAPSLKMGQGPVDNVPRESLHFRCLKNVGNMMTQLYCPISVNKTTYGIPKRLLCHSHNLGFITRLTLLNYNLRLKTI